MRSATRWCVLVLGMSGCSGSMTPVPPTPVAPMAPALAISCSDSIDQIYAMPSGLPAFDASHRGDVASCAVDQHLSAQALRDASVAFGYTGNALTEGAFGYRIAYRTERLQATDGSTPGGLSSAVVFFPEHPKDNAPLVVYAHGSTGLAARCAPSRSDPWVPILALVGQGYPVIAPDYAGFGYGDAPGWSVSADEAHSLLDATRAFANLVPAASRPTKVVLVGHSQGGHGVLSAQSLAKDYGLSGELVGVATLAPFWLTALSWGALTSSIAGIKTADAPYLVEYMLDYFYSHGALYDGAANAGAMFASDKRATIENALDTQCLTELADSLPAMMPLASDFFPTAFGDSVGQCSLGISDCSDEPAKTWMTRFLADRPALDGTGAPVLIFQGNADTTIVPTRAQCGFDKLAKDLAGATAPTITVTTCADADATHTTIVPRSIDNVAQWIAARALGAPEPAACPAWTPVKCDTPPANL